MSGTNEAQVLGRKKKFNGIQSPAKTTNPGSSKIDLEPQT